MQSAAKLFESRLLTFHMSDHRGRVVMERGSHARGWRRSFSYIMHDFSCLHLRRYADSCCLNRVRRQGGLQSFYSAA